MKRRALLSAVAAGGLAGCLTERRPATVVGVSRRAVDIAYCGDVIGRPCESVDEIDFPPKVSSDVSSRRQGEFGATQRDGRVLVRGSTYGIGDPDCRGTRVSRIELRDGTLGVTVRNLVELGPDGCVESAAAVEYLVTVSFDHGDSVERVHVEHYSHRDELRLSGTVPV